MRADIRDRFGQINRFRLGRAPRRIVASAGVAAMLLVPIAFAAPSIADAAGILYFSHERAHAVREPESGTISSIPIGEASAEPRGTEPQTLFETGEKTAPAGIALDPAASRIYWVEQAAGEILAGPIGGSPAVEEGQPAAKPEVLFEGEPGDRGLTIDPATKRLYWVNTRMNEILSGGLGGKAEGAPVVLYKEPEGSEPVGITVDPATNKLYWTDNRSGEIRSGGTSGEPAQEAETLYEEGSARPSGIALDAATGRLYWTDEAGVNGKERGEIRVGSSGGVSAPAKTLFEEKEAATKPYGLALDPAAGEIYWSDFGSGAMKAGSLDGEEAAATGVTLAETEAEGPRSLALLMPPAAVGAPIANGADAAGEKLSCSTGTWGSDMPEASFYEALSSLGYQWLLDGSPVPSATASTFIPSVGGTYSCEVSAADAAGVTTQASAAVSILAPQPTATITSPASGGTYTQGEVVPTSFFCTEGPGGSGLASCDDQYGADTVSGGSGHLETSMIGPHVYVVEAISKDGRRSGAVITYEVIRRAIAAALPSVRIATARAPVLSGKAEVKLACAAAAPCSGKLVLKARVKVSAGKGKHRRARFRTVVVGHARYRLAPGKSRLLALKLTRRALSLLAHGVHLRLKAVALATLHGGKSVQRTVVLVAHKIFARARGKAKKRNGRRHG